MPVEGVAFHHSGIPKYIQTEIVELFNSGVINTIVCTPTLTEGVNTTAKNVVFYDTTKADIDLTGFEVKILWVALVGLVNTLLEELYF